MMNSASNDESPGAVQTARYRIRVSGALGPDWSDRLGGLFITATGRAGESSTTILEGELRDQGALIGVLNTLHDLRMDILSVERPEVLSNMS